MSAAARYVNIHQVFQYLSVLALVVMVCGCSSGRTQLVSESLDLVPLVSGSVVNSLAVAKGGHIGLGAFRPGAGAAANEQTDELSQMLVAGIRDSLLSTHTQFTLGKDAQRDPDCILEGTIENYGRQAGAILGAHDRMSLVINGNIWLRDTGEKILLFQGSVVIDAKRQDPKTSAYQMGVAVARFIELESQR